MTIEPYTTEFQGHTWHRARVRLDDGRTLDLKSQAGALNDEQWAALAAAVGTEPEPMALGPGEPDEEILFEVEVEL